MRKKLNETELLEQFKKEFIEHMIEFRIKKNMNQKELGELLNVSQQTISKIESGDFNYNLTTVAKVLALTGKKMKIK